MRRPWVHLVSTSLSATSRSRAVGLRVLAALAERGAGISWTDWRDCERVGCVSSDITDYPEGHRVLFDTLLAADGVLIAAPVHNFAPSGECLNFLGICGKALARKPLGVISASGGIRSHLAIAPLIVTLTLSLHAHVYGETVHTADGVDEGDLQLRVVRFAEGFDRYCRALTTASTEAPADPSTSEQAPPSLDAQEVKVPVRTHDRTVQTSRVEARA